MATSSAQRLNAPLKTYSRRVNSKEEPQPSKKRHIEEVAIAVQPSLPKKFKRSSIQSYFKSLPSPAPTSSDPLEPTSTPPSSPPSRTSSPPTQSKALQRPRRRLKARPYLAPINKMSDSGDEGIFSLEMDGGEVLGGRGKSGSANAAPSTPSSFTSGNSSPTRTRGTTIIGFPSTISEKTSDSSKIDGRSRAQTIAPFGISALVQLAACEGPVRSTSPVKGSYSGLLSGKFDNTDADIHFHPDSKFPCFAPTASTVNTPTPPINIPKKATRVSSGTTQVLLDLGAERFIECKTCGLYYNQTNKKDRAEHDKFHQEFTEGKAPKKTTPNIDIWEKYVDLTPNSSLSAFYHKNNKNGEVHRVRAVDRNASNELRFHLEEALDKSYEDMGGLKVNDKELWSEITNPHNPSDPHKVPRYKLFVYSIALEPVGVLLVERISNGRIFIDNQVLSSNKQKAYMSVDRIWVKKERRGEGIASQMVDLAREHFIPGLVLAKKDIAFSFPTAAGVEFGRKYTGRAFSGAWFLVHL